MYYMHHLNWLRLPKARGLATQQQPHHQQQHQPSQQGSAEGGQPLGKPAASSDQASPGEVEGFAVAVPNNPVAGILSGLNLASCSQGLPRLQSSQSQSRHYEIL